MYKKFNEARKNLSKVLNLVLSCQLSNFYINKYRKLNLQKDLITYEEFQKIPFLTRNEILLAPWEDRCFVEQTEIAHIVNSSGSTDINKLLAIPWSKKTTEEYGNDSPDNVLSHAKVEALGIHRILILIPGTLGFYYATMYFPRCGAIPVPGDVRDLAGTARLCESLSIDAIMTIPSLLQTLIPELDKVGFNRNNVKWLYYQGEVMSQTRLSFMKEAFPNAQLEGNYGSIEMHVGGYQCCKQDFEVNSYHPSPRHFIEILDDNDKPLPEGKFGNLIITDISTERALPLIRYKTGDTASISRAKCPCGNDLLLKIGGRNNFDLLRVFGVTFSKVVLENSIGDLMKKMNDYELCLEEINCNGKLKPKLTLKVDTNEDFDALKQALDTALTQSFYLTKDKTIAYFTDCQIFEPFEIIRYKSKKTGKHRAIVLNLN